MQLHSRVALAKPQSADRFCPFQVPSGTAMVGFEWGKQDLSVNGDSVQQHEPSPTDVHQEPNQQQQAPEVPALSLSLARSPSIALAMHNWHDLNILLLLDIQTLLFLKQVYLETSVV